MSEDQEIAAAAASGAAAAVSQVQDQQAQEEATERAETAATIAAETATEATETAATAATIADAASDAAESAQAGTEALGEATAVSLAGVHERISRVEQKQDEFVEEARGFFNRLEDRFKDHSGEVQQVEVGNATDTANTQASGDSGQASANRTSESGASQTGDSPRSRHRWGSRL